MGVDMGLMIEFSRVFPDEQHTVENLTVGIPKEIIIKAGSAFLAQQTLDHSSVHWLDMAHNWFREDNFPFKQELISRVGSNYSQHELPGLSMLMPQSSLKLLQLGFLKPAVEDVIKSELQIEIDLYKVYLLINETYTQQQIKSSPYIEEKYPDMFLGLLLLNIGFSSNELVNFNFAREFFCQSIKAIFLSDWISKETKLVPHLVKFYERYAVTSLKNYHERIIGFLGSISKKEKPGFIEFKVDKEDDKIFVSKISVQDYLKEDDVDFKVVRAAPLVNTDADTYRITHPLFISDKLYKGLYFDFSKINESLEHGQKIKAFRSFYTTHFSEHYLFYEVIKYFIRKSYKQFSGSVLSEMGIDGAPDYYIRNGKHIFLMENKDILIKAEVKENNIFEALEAELKKKFLEDENKPVGIKQIAANVERVLALQNVFDTDYKPQNAVIYPVLVVHDIVYDSPGLNHLFNEWFFIEIKKLKEKGLPVTNVRPLVIISIDTLIFAAEALKSGNVSLSELLEVYYKHISQSKRIFKTIQERNEAITNQYLPSSKVLENWLDKYHYAFTRKNKILEYAFSKIEK